MLYQMTLRPFAHQVSRKQFDTHRNLDTEILLLTNCTLCDPKVLEVGNNCLKYLIIPICLDHFSQLYQHLYITILISCLFSYRFILLTN